MRLSLPFVQIYVLNYIDRNNASAARLKGFEKDLGLQGQQFATVLSILYVVSRDTPLPVSENGCTYHLPWTFHSCRATFCSKSPRT